MPPTNAAPTRTSGWRSVSVGGAPTGSVTPGSAGGGTSGAIEAAGSRGRAAGGAGGGGGGRPRAWAGPPSSPPCRPVGFRSLRRIFPEHAPPNQGRRLRRRDGGEGAEPREEPRPEEALGDVVVHGRLSQSHRARGGTRGGTPLEPPDDRLDDEPL